MPYNTGPVKELSPEECWDYLKTTTVARIALSVGGDIDIFPINVYADGKSLLFRTAPGTKLLELTVHDRVAVEADGHTEADAWSVVIKGTARELQHQSEIDEADASPLDPWVPTLKYRYVKVEPVSITGRYFERSGEPER